MDFHRPSIYEGNSCPTLCTPLSWPWKTSLSGFVRPWLARSAFMVVFPRRPGDSFTFPASFRVQTPTRVMCSRQHGKTKSRSRREDLDASCHVTFHAPRQKEPAKRGRESNSQCWRQNAAIRRLFSRVLERRTEGREDDIPEECIQMRKTVIVNRFGRQYRRTSINWLLVINGFYYDF